MCIGFICWHFSFMYPSFCPLLFIFCPHPFITPFLSHLIQPIIKCNLSCGGSDVQRGRREMRRLFKPLTFSRRALALIAESKPEWVNEQGLLFFKQPAPPCWHTANCKKIVQLMSNDVQFALPPEISGSELLSNVLWSLSCSTCPPEVLTPSSTTSSVSCYQSLQLPPWTQLFLIYSILFYNTAHNTV